jgi:hypothetical protein
MAVKPLFTIEPFKLPAPAQRSAPLGQMPALARGDGFAGSLGLAQGGARDADKIAAASELMLNQGLMDIMSEGGDGEGGGGGMNTLLLTSLLGLNGPGGAAAGLPPELSALLGNFPGGTEGLVKALRQVAATQAGQATGAETGAPAAAAAPAATLPAAVAAHPAPATDETAAIAEIESAGSAQGLARSSGLRAYARALPKTQDGAEGAAAAPAAKPVAQPKPDLLSNLLGRLSARFESGGDPAAIGYDRVGGTSYGIYQLSSKAGTVDQFIGFLQARRPDLAAALEVAGRADTGGTGGAMPATWRALAAQDPEGFANLQHEFISQSHFLPAAERIKEITGLDLAGNPALAEVLWSTSVQHGASGAANLIADSIEAVGKTGSPGFAANLVGEIYKRRAGRFASSDAPVQEAVRSRLKQERDQALTLLRAGGLLDSEV